MDLPACCSELQWVAVSCSVLQCVEVCFSLTCHKHLSIEHEWIYLRVAVSCSELQWVAVSCSELQWVAVSCSVLQCVAVCFSPTYHKHFSIEHERIYLRVAVSCSELQCVAVFYSVLQCLAVRCLETIITFVQRYFNWHCSHSALFRDNNNICTKIFLLTLKSRTMYKSRLMWVTNHVSRPKGAVRNICTHIIIDICVTN